MARSKLQRNLYFKSIPWIHLQVTLASLFHQVLSAHPDSSKTTRVTSTALPSHPPLQSLRVWCPLPTPLSLMTQGSVTCCNHGLVPSSCHGHTSARGTEFLRESLNPKTNQNMALGGHLRAAHCVPVLAHSSPPDTHPHAAR